MQSRDLGRHVAPLRPSDLSSPTTPGTLRTFDGPAGPDRAENELRRTALGVLTFTWLSDQELRCPLFPTLWAATPTFVIGRTYRVVGTVAFRDRTPPIEIVGIERPGGGPGGDHEHHPGGDQRSVRLVDGGASMT
jgi:hypothetical protein